ncbi:TraR/DksA C4-type zinc finger protein [Desulfobulbus elongatus]|uniref:TraR/DksA C4-type zinc finger protein n=1 Tax=Desulfobulbus elongatus TaxID=53332 RepID=UPI0009FC914F|nr:TraR/DksA C4-type zinc finger protein [Desulfobulbus elongatus]
MDDVDIAQELREAELRHLLAARAYALPHGESAEECDDCGEPIPEARRQAAPGCTRCVFCQQRFERRMREGR